MRISVVPGDPGEIENAKLKAAGKRAKILLDGVEKTRCITADEEQGWLKRYVTDEAGKMVFKGGEVQTETLRGTVKIEIEG